MKFIEKAKINRNMTALIFVSGAMAMIWEFSKQDLTEKKIEEELPSADTYVPEGFVLVPIEVQNAESLDAILGNFGIVDIYRPSLEPNSPSTLIARQIKILRAPLDPRKFAVLVPSDQSQSLVRVDTPLFVTINNPKHKSERFVRTSKGPSRIQFE